jgi:2-aminoadipate transaminase
MPDATAVSTPATPKFAARADGISGSIIDASISLLQDQPRDVISFAMGCPAPDALPGAALADIAHLALLEPDAAVLNYGATEGTPAMRRALLSMLAGDGAPPPGEEIIVTTGGMQSLDLACKLLVERGSVVLTESPTYTNATATITSYGGQVLEVPVDDDGLVVDAIPDAVARLGRTPEVIHVIPNFQNPRGSTMALGRRRRLLELAEQYGACIIEDDPYGLLRFEGEDLPTLHALSAGRVPVVYVGTFSKILAPGLRVGWVQAPAVVVARMVDAKQGMDTCTNMVGQRMVADFLARGLMPSHLDHLRSTYRDKRDAVVAALDARFGAESGVSWTMPHGGFFLWLTLPEDVDATALSAAALRAGVAVLPGPAFSPSGRFGNCLRICFTFPSLDELDEGVARLHAAYAQAKL